jgi:hypothetical protein
VTTPRPVSTPFISSWKASTIAYATQNTARVTSRVRSTARSTARTATTAMTASTE